MGRVANRLAPPKRTGRAEVPRQSKSGAAKA